MTTTQRGGTTEVTIPLSPQMKPAELLRVQRLARELRLTDQILSVDVDKVSVHEFGPAAGWTSLTGDHISFAMDKMPKPDTVLDVAVWLGVNAHELGHVLHSPRKDSTLMFRVLESERTFMPGVAMLHNVVEDQRQERLVLAQFGPWSGYLVAALSHVLDAKVEDAWLLFAGRTWLPQSVRDEAKAGMIVAHGQIVTDRVTAIVGEYQRLTDPGETEADEAWALLQELFDMFGDAMPDLGTGCRVMEGGEPSTGEPSDDAPPTADEADAAPPTGDDDSAGQPSGSSDDDDDTDDEPTGSGSGNADADADDADDDAEPPSGSGAEGAGSKPGAPGSMKQVKDALRKAAETTLHDDDDAADDVKQVMDALDSSPSNERAGGEKSPGRYREPTDSARALHREVADALLDLKDEREPGWLKRTDNGRLNVRRMLDPSADADTMFDRYEPGMLDTTEMEVMVLLDVSGSMGSKTYRLAEAAWAIRHAVDDMEGRCTVFTWDSGPHHVLADASDRPDDRMLVPDSMGGTDPESVLNEAFQLVAGSEARNRLVIILTDGDWSDPQTSEAVIDAMNEYGVTTVCALLGRTFRQSLNTGGLNGHRCQHVAQIDDPLDLARLFRQVAVERITSW